ncbi:SIR2 family protein [Pseudarthrobacter oxydans]|uniref:SIR2 family protein n=1 Tax=Pseudarthrobacter oxydans TaxID=1671 RepID=UPI0015731B52|nr:SIR2 family protein [Pseudarthrobacter oxydans]NSX38641.1 SIR2 family protein [Pseudarthrobacter oxydans]
MSAADIDDTVITVLRDAVHGKKDYAVLLGAGASAGAGLPDWNELSVELLVRSGAIADEETAKAFLAYQDPALAAEAAKTAAGAGWESVLVDGLYSGAPSDLRPGALHLALANLAAQAQPGDIRLFTLNFDTLLEDALTIVSTELGAPVPSYSRSTFSDRAPSNQFEVHHLHGVIERSGANARNVVLTLSEFNDLVTEKSSWQQAELAQALGYGPLILAGTSYRDSDIRAWLSELAPKTTSKIVVFLARQGLGLSKTQFASVLPSLEKQWKAIDVHAIITQDHADAAQALRELPYFEEPDYCAPSVRAADLWSSCVANFEGLQKEHSDYLRAESVALEAAMGRPSNIVLWVSNAEGSAVKWSSPDRIYRDAALLRKVPAGHDSQWIVGRCLGSDDILAEDLSELSDEVRRWRFVIALPVVVDRPGGPPFTFGAVTLALEHVPDNAELAMWRLSLEPIAEDWSERLSRL